MVTFSNLLRSTASFLKNDLTHLKDFRKYGKAVHVCKDSGNIVRRRYDNSIMNQKNTGSSIKTILDKNGNTIEQQHRTVISRINQYGPGGADRFDVFRHKNEGTEYSSYNRYRAKGQEEYHYDEIKEIPLEDKYTFIKFAGCNEAYISPDKEITIVNKSNGEVKKTLESVERINRFYESNSRILGKEDLFNKIVSYERINGKFE